MTETLWMINHDIALTDAELAERQEWIDYLTNLTEPDEVEFEVELDMWEANHG